MEFLSPEYAFILILDKFWSRWCFSSHGGFICNTFKTLCMLETMATLANTGDPDEMQHKAAFHQGLHCLLTLK